MREKLYGLQALRALAAAYVVFAHAQLTFAEKVGALSPIDVLSFVTGEAGVALFFAISGFIIYSTSAHLEAGSVSVKTFAWRRVSRIVPIYWLATAIYGAKLALTIGAPPAENFLKSLFFIPYGTELMRPVLGSGWTLNYEMFFYLVFCATLLLRLPWRLPVMLAVFGSLRVVAATGGMDGPGWHGLKFLSTSYLDFFLLGMLLAYARTKLKQYPVGISAGAATGWSMALFTAGIAAAAQLGPGGEAWHLPIVGTTLFIALLEAPGAHDSRVLALLKAAGDASFSTYLTHGFVMGPAARLLALTGVSVSSLVFSLLMVLACAAVGYLVYLYVEKPMLKWMLSFQPAPPQKLEPTKSRTC